MSYPDTARAFARAEDRAHKHRAASAALLPLSEWADLRRDIATPQTIAANHALHVQDAAYTLRNALRIQAQSDRERMVTQDEAAQMVAESARALLAAIGEAE